MNSYEEIYNRLPGTWAELKLKDYVKLITQDYKPDDPEDEFVRYDNEIRIISKLTGVSTATLECIPPREVAGMSNKIAFMKQIPETRKTVIKWKKVEEISYSDYVTFVRLCKDMYNNMASIIQSFSYKQKVFDKGEFFYEPYEIEEVLDMPMDEVHSGFFLLSLIAEKSRNRTRKYLSRKLKKSGMKLSK